jgi:hypothetical protein
VAATQARDADVGAIEALRANDDADALTVAPGGAKAGVLMVIVCVDWTKWLDGSTDYYPN